jgi:hypothetical protein
MNYRGREAQSYYFARIAAVASGRYTSLSMQRIARRLDRIFFFNFFILYSVFTDGSIHFSTVASGATASSTTISFVIPTTGYSAEILLSCCLYWVRCYCCLGCGSSHVAGTAILFETFSDGFNYYLWRNINYGVRYVILSLSLPLLLLTYLTEAVGGRAEAAVPRRAGQDPLYICTPRRAAVDTHRIYLSK